MASTNDRGYGWQHQQRRAAIAPEVDAGHATCWRCGQPIQAGEPWDLGHDDHDRSVYRGPEHRGRCNRRAGAMKVNAKRAKRSRPPIVHSQRW